MLFLTHSDLRLSPGGRGERVVVGYGRHHSCGLAPSTPTLILELIIKYSPWCANIGFATRGTRPLAEECVPTVRDGMYLDERGSRVYSSRQQPLGLSGSGSAK
jgi:hypothetical protein